MSHFSCLVVTPNKPSDQELSAILQPWHEYECTGKRDQYVVEVEVPIDEILEQYNKPQEVVVLNPASDTQVIFSRYDDTFYTKEHDDPFEKRLGRKQFELPKGAEIQTINADEARKFGLGYATMFECAKDYFGAEIERDGKFYKVTNPNAKWDWWAIGGRWTGMLVPHYEPGTDPRNKEVCTWCSGHGLRLSWPDYGDEHFNELNVLSKTIIHGTKYDPNNEIHQKLKCNGCDGKGIQTKWPTDWVRIAGDQMKLENIPLIAIRDEHERKALTRYDNAQAVIAGRPFITWTEARKQSEDDMAKARELYNEQPVIKDLREAKILDFLDEPDDFRLTREQVSKKARAGAICPFAFVHEGKWYQRGEMGWWACVNDEKERGSWNEEFNNMLDSLPKDYWLTVVDCHI